MNTYSIYINGQLFDRKRNYYEAYLAYNNAKLIGGIVQLIFDSTGEIIEKS